MNTNKILSVSPSSLNRPKPFSTDNIVEKKPVQEKKKVRPDKSKKTKSKKKERVILHGNGHHKAVGILKGTLTFVEKKKLGRSGEKATKIRQYNLEISNGMKIKAVPLLGIRVLATNKPGEIINKEHHYIVYPKYNKKGEFFVEIAAYDDNEKSKITKVCDNLEFMLIGVWYKDTLSVQQSKEIVEKQKTKRPNYPRIFKYKLKFSESWKTAKPYNGALYKVSAFLDEDGSLVVMKMDDFTIPLESTR